MRKGLPSKFWQNQCGNELLIRATVSPNRRRESAVPPQPELLEITIAKRESCAPAQSDVFPNRQCPMTATLVALM